MPPHPALLPALLSTMLHTALRPSLTSPMPYIAPLPALLSLTPDLLNPMPHYRLTQRQAPPSPTQPHAPPLSQSYSATRPAPLLALLSLIPRPTQPHSPTYSAPCLITALLSAKPHPALLSAKPHPVLLSAKPHPALLSHTPRPSLRLGHALRTTRKFKRHPVSDYQRHVENCSTHRIPSNYCDYGGPRSGHSQTVAVARMVSGTESGRRRLSPGTPAPTHRPRKRRPALREYPHHKPLPLVRRSKKKAWRVIILIYLSAFCLCWPDFVWNKSSAHVCIFSKPGQPFSS